MCTAGRRSPHRGLVQMSTEYIHALAAQREHWPLEPGALAAVFQLELQQNAYVFIFQDEAFTATNFAFYLSQLEALYATAEAFVLVMDFTHLRWPPMTFFWRQVAFLRDHADDMRRCVIWSLLIVRSPELRGLLNLLFQIVPPQRPFWVLDVATLAHERMGRAPQRRSPRGIPPETHKDRRVCAQYRHETI